MHDTSESSPGQNPPPRLFTFRSIGWVLLLSAFFSALSAALVLYPVFKTGFHQSVGDGKNVDSYGFDLSNLTLPRNTFVASGWPKDVIRAIPESLIETNTPAEIDMMHKNEHLNFLIPTDRIVGLTINGEVRAYPLRVLNYHEVINDTLGGTPIAITYAPLCDSVVVFDRRVDGPTAPPLEFGVSGLLVDSDLIAFDRRPHAKGESLWAQLSLKAVSGPLAGQPMKLVPYELATWKDWTAQHPDARVVIGLRTLKQQYTFEPYAAYLNNDELKFPVYPLWTDTAVPRKTRIAITGSEGGRWIARPEGAAASSSQPATMGTDITLHSFVFASFALHPDDTDYSAVK